MYRLSYKYRLGNLQVSVKSFTSIGEEIKVQFTRHKVNVSVKFQVSVR